MEIRNKFIGAACNTVYSGIDWSDKHNIIAYGASNQVYLFDIDKIKILATLTGHIKRVNCVKFFQKANHYRLISGSADGSVIIWKNDDNPFLYQAWSILTKIQLPDTIINISLYEISSSSVLICGITGKCDITIWHFHDDQLEKLETLLFGTNFQYASAIEQLEENKFLLFLGGVDNQIHIYSLILPSQKPQLNYVVSLKGHENAITDLKLTGIYCENKIKSYFLASSSKDSFIRIWRISKYNYENDKMQAFQNKNNYKLQITENDLYILSLESVLNGHTDSVSSINWGKLNPQCEFPMENDLILLSTSFDFSILLWSQNQKSDIWLSRTRLGQLGGNKNAFYYATFNKANDKLFAYTFNGAFYLWRRNQDNYILIPTISGHFNSVTDIDWSSNGHYLVSCSSDQTTRLYCEWKKTGTYHEISRAQIHGYDLNTIRNLHVKPRDDHIYADYLISGGDEKIIRMFEPSPSFLNILNTLTGVDHRLFFEDPEKEKNYLMNNNSNQVRYKVNVEGITQVLGLMTKAIPVDKITIKYGADEDEGGEGALEEENKDASSVIDYDFSYPPVEDYLVRHTLWPELNKLYGHGYEIKAIATSHKDTLIASSCKSQTQDHATIFIWDPKTYSVIDRLTFHHYTVVQLEFSRDDEYLISVSRDRFFSLFKRDNGNKMHLYNQIFYDQSHLRIIWSTSFSHDTKYFATSSRDKTTKIWQIDHQNSKVFKICELNHETGVTAVAFANRLSYESHYILAIGLENGVIQICQFDSEAKEAKLKDKIHQNIGHSLTINRIRFRYSEDKETLTFATASDDNSVRIYELLNV